MPRELHRGRITQGNGRTVKSSLAKRQQHEGGRPTAKKPFRAIVGIRCWLTRSVHPLARVSAMVLTPNFPAKEPVEDDPGYYPGNSIREPLASLVVASFDQRDAFGSGSYCNPKCPVALPYGGLVGDLGKSGNNQRHGEQKRNRPDPRGGVTPHVPELSVVVNVSHCGFGVMNTIPAPDLAIEKELTVQMTLDRGHILVRRCLGPQTPL
ncbi:hypothetical protein An01g00840 [Aspergillus niger]|uniref:Uncharacterized protein n=2 Tax=Aspergillus niger TaxID=5061 RepID=A2Q7I6_ASPNC|nr:hypothetical protein An01g00840 [Aspergillus niger]CAK43462.1 hypothetical protein An01g00840 [Aspergillus niger]